MKRLVPILIVATLIPKIALAAWWNPLSWEIFNPPTPPVESVEEPTPKEKVQLNKIPVQEPLPKAKPKPKSKDASFSSAEKNTAPAPVLDEEQIRKEKRKSIDYYVTSAQEPKTEVVEEVEEKKSIIPSVECRRAWAAYPDVSARFEIRQAKYQAERPATDPSLEEYSDEEKNYRADLGLIMDEITQVKRNIYKHCEG